MNRSVMSILILLILMACKGNSGGEMHIGKGMATGASFATDEVALESKRSVIAPPAKQVERTTKQIKRGRLTFETENLSNTKRTIVDLVKANDGYISSDNQEDNESKTSNYLTLRLPASKFDAFITNLSKSVTNFERKEITVEDVTDRYYDLKSRIKNKKELEKKYLQILQKAKSVKDILDVEKEINKLRTEIESMQGRFQYLDKQVSYSTISIHFYQNTTASSNFSSDIFSSFQKGLTYLKGFFLGIISIWPFVLIGLVLYFLFKKIRKRK